MSAFDAQKHRANRDALMKAFKVLKKNEITFQSLHFRNTQNTWKDTQYYEVRHILCNIWMTMICGLEKSKCPLLSGEITLDSIQNAWMSSPYGSNGFPLGQGYFVGNEKLLNILERLHRVVCTKYALYEGLNIKDVVPPHQGWDEDMLGGLLHSFVNKEPIRQHGRSCCTCGLWRSVENVANKKSRIKQIRELLCFEWADDLQQMLRIRDDIPGYGAGDGPFQNTYGDPHAERVGEQHDEIMQWPTWRLNEMLLTLWKIICLPDPAVYLVGKACPLHTDRWWWEVIASKELLLKNGSRISEKTRQELDSITATEKD